MLALVGVRMALVGACWRWSALVAHIYKPPGAAMYGHVHAQQVDMNAALPLSREPVENIHW